MRRYTLLIILSLLLAACGSNSGDALPTTIAPVDQQTETPAVEVTSTPRGRPTLPPSWTPQPSETPTPAPTNAPLPTVEATNPPPECAPFAADAANTDNGVQLGSTAQIVWQPVEGARLYRVLVFDLQQNVVLEEFTAENRYIIPATVFQAAARYTWEAIPLDAVGTQMCPGQGDVLNVRR